MSEKKCSEIAKLEEQLLNNYFNHDIADTIASNIASLKQKIDYSKCVQNKDRADVSENAKHFLGFGGRRSGKKSRCNSKKRKTLRKKNTRRKTRSHKKYLFF